jgi:hypothetical protein
MNLNIILGDKIMTKLYKLNKLFSVVEKTITNTYGMKKGEYGIDGDRGHMEKTIQYRGGIRHRTIKYTCYENEITTTQYQNKYYKSDSECENIIMAKHIAKLKDDGYEQYPPVSLLEKIALFNNVPIREVK